MKKLYSVHPVEHEGDFFFCLFEEQTQQPYDFYYFQEDAINEANELENGKAFAGFTPSFVLKSINIVVGDSDINRTFNNIFEENITEN